MVLGSSGPAAATPSRTRPPSSRTQPRVSAAAAPRTRTPSRSTAAAPASPSAPSSPTSNPRLEDLSPDNASAVALAAWTRDLKGLWSRAEERFADVCWTSAPPYEAVDPAEDVNPDVAQENVRPNYATPPSSPKEDPPEFLWAHQAIIACRAQKTFAARYLDLPYAKPIQKPEASRAKAVVGRSSTPLVRSNGSSSAAAKPTLRKTSAPPSSFNLKSKSAAAIPPGNSPRKPTSGRTSASGSATAAKRTATRTATPAPKATKTSIISPPPTPIPPPLSSLASQLQTVDSPKVVKPLSLHGQDMNVMKETLTHLYTGDEGTPAIESDLAPDQLPVVAASEVRMDRLRSDMLALWKSHQHSDVTLRVGQGAGDSSAEGDALLSNGLEHSASVISLPLADAEEEESAGSFAAHRFILVSRSPYFAAQLLSPFSDSNSTDIRLPTPPFTPSGLYFTLGFLYTGTLNFSSRSFDLTIAFQIWRAGAYFQVRSLTTVVGSLIFHDFCHKFTCSPPCTTCLKRVPRTVAFAASPDVAETTLLNAAKEAVSGRDFGSYWAREVGTMSPALRTSLLESVKSHIKAEHGACIWVLRQSMMVISRLDGERSVKWTDTLRGMTEAVVEHVQKRLVATFEKVVDSAEWSDLVDGVGLLYDVLEKALQLLFEGINESRAAKIYQVLVGEVLLKGEGGLEPGPARNKVEECRTELIKYLRKRWVNVRATAGFNGLDRWALKEIAGEIDVPSEELLLEETPPAPLPAISRTGLKAATPGRTAVGAKASDSSVTPKRTLGAASRTLAKNVDREREAGPVDLRAAVLNRNAAKTSATHGFRSGTSSSSTSSPRATASSASSASRPTASSAASSSRTATAGTPTRTPANPPSHVRSGAPATRPTASTSVSRRSAGTSGTRASAATSTASSSRAGGKAPQRPLPASPQKDTATKARPLSRAPRSSGSSTPSGHARTASSVSAATISHASEPQSPNPCQSDQTWPTAAEDQTSAAEATEPVASADPAPAAEIKDEENTDANSDSQAHTATNGESGNSSARVASPDIAARPRRTAMGSKVAGLAARFSGDSPPIAVAELPSIKGKPYPVPQLAVATDATTSGDVATEPGPSGSEGPSPKPATPVDEPSVESPNGIRPSPLQPEEPVRLGRADDTDGHSEGEAAHSRTDGSAPLPPPNSAAPAVTISDDSATQEPPLSPLPGVPPKGRNNSLVSASSTKPPAPSRAASVASLMALRASARRNAALRSMSHGPTAVQRPPSSLAPPRPEQAHEAIAFPISSRSGSATPTSDQSEAATIGAGAVVGDPLPESTLPATESCPASLGALAPSEEETSVSPANGADASTKSEGMENHALPSERQAARSAGQDSEATSEEGVGDGPADPSTGTAVTPADSGTKEAAESADPPVDATPTADLIEPSGGETAPRTDVTAKTVEAVGADDVEGQEQKPSEGEQTGVAAEQAQATETAAESTQDQEQPVEAPAPPSAEHLTEPADPEPELLPAAASEDGRDDAETTPGSSEPVVAGSSPVNGDAVPPAAESVSPDASPDDGANAEAEADAQDAAPSIAEDSQPAQPANSVEHGINGSAIGEGEADTLPVQTSHQHSNGDASPEADGNASLEMVKVTAQETLADVQGKQDPAEDAEPREKVDAVDPTAESNFPESTTQETPQEDPGAVGSDADPRAAEPTPSSTADISAAQTDPHAAFDYLSTEGREDAKGEEVPALTEATSTDVIDDSAQTDDEVTPQGLKQESDAAASASDTATSAGDGEDRSVTDPPGASATSDMLAASESDLAAGDEPRTPKAIKSTALPLAETDKTPRPSKMISHVNAAMELAKTPRSASLADFPATSLSVGIPCIIWPILPGVPPRTKMRALVKYVGPVEGYAGPMVGVEIPRPLPEGLQVAESRFNDGTLGGKMYFRLGASDSAAPSAAPSGANSPVSSANTSPSMLGNGGSRLSVHLDMFARAEREARKRRIARLQANAMRVVSGGSTSSSMSTSNSFGNAVFSAPVSPRAEHIAPQPSYHTLMPNASTSAIVESSDDDYGFGSETEGLPTRYGVRSPRPSLPSPMSSPTLRFPRLGAKQYSDRNLPGRMESPPSSFSGTSLYMNHGARDGERENYPERMPSSSGLPGLPSTFSTTPLPHPFLSTARERERRCSWSPSLASVFTSRSAAASSVRSFSRGSRRSSFASRMEEDGPGYGLFVTPEEVMWVFEDE